MIRLFKNLLFFMTLSTLISSNVFADDIFSATSNKKEVATGEEFILSFDYNGKTDIDKPDFSILKEAGINIIGTNQSSRKYRNNNDISFSKKWQISVTSDKEEGKIIVPSISINSLSTSSIEIKINNEEKENNLYKVYNSISEKEPYINQQIDFNITIENSVEMSMNEPQFTAQSLVDWIIIKTRQPEVIQGQTKKIRFFYTIFPQKTGEIKLPTAKIEAYLENSYNNNDYDGININSFIRLATRHMQKEIISTPLQKIVVKPAIKSQTSKIWLPAKKVEIAAKWNANKKDFKVGEVISRDIVITAVGANEHAMPKISLKEIKDVKQYPSNPTSSITMINNQVNAMINLSSNYIFNKEGNVTIPEEVIEWYNIDTKKIEKAILTEETIYIEKGQSYLENNINISIPEKSSEKTQGTSNNLNQYIYMIGSFITGFIISLFLFNSKKDKKKNKTEKKKTYKKENKSISDYQNEVILSAKNNDYKNIEKNILLWAKNKFDKNISNMQDVKNQINNEEFSQELENILEQIYSKKETSWDNQKFLKVFKKICKEKQIDKKKNKDILPKLYK